MKKKTKERICFCAGVTIGFAGTLACHEVIVRTVPYSYRTSVPEFLNYVTDYRGRPVWMTKTLRAMGSQLA